MVFQTFETLNGCHCHCIISCAELLIMMGTCYNVILFVLGKMKGLAFVQDPDGYWIEILNQHNMANI